MKHLNFTTKQLVLTALFTALACVATMSIRIPTPATNGYIHPGDAIILLSGVFLSPVCAFLAAGIGSAAADFFGGYLLYVPATFLIKGLIAALTALLVRRVCRSVRLALVLGGLIDMLLVAGGYLLFELPLYGIAALASVPSNLIQGASGLVIASLLLPFLALRPLTVRQS